jgi:hypothetical protein
MAELKMWSTKLPASQLILHIFGKLTDLIRTQVAALKSVHSQSRHYDLRHALMSQFLTDFETW